MNENFNGSQFSSAKGVAEYQTKIEKAEALAKKERKETAHAQQIRDSIEAKRFEASEKARTEKEHLESVRFQDSRRLSLIAIWIALLSVVISIFK